MPNKRIDQLNPNLNSLTGNELIPIFDLSSNTTEKITIDTLGAYIDSINDTFINSVGFNNSTDLLTLYRNDGTNLSTTINRYNRWYVPSGQTLTIPNNFQSFIYGDFIVEGVVNLQENAQLVVLNGDIILSGGTIIGSGTTYSIGLPEFNTFVTNGIFNNTTKQINFTGNYGFTPFNVDLSPLIFTGNTISECISDIYVSNVHSCSPLHINPNDEGNVYFGSTSGVTIDVTNGVISANTINVTTYYGDGSNLTNILPYKVYTSLITMTGETVLSPIVMSNSLGFEPEWIKVSSVTSGFNFPTTVDYDKIFYTITPNLNTSNGGGGQIQSNGGYEFTLGGYIPNKIDESFEIGYGFGINFGQFGSTTNVETITPFSNGFLVGGNFTSYSGITCGPMLFLNQNGTINDSFVSGFDTGMYNPTVSTIEVQPIPGSIPPVGFKFLVGGSFSLYSGLSYTNLIRLNTDGTIDETFSVGVGFDGTINTIAVQSDAKILVGGDFSNYSGESYSRIIRLNYDGSIDETFNIGNGFDYTVNSITIQDDNKILVGGGYNTYNGLEYRGLIRLNTDGSVDGTFNIGGGFIDDGSTGTINKININPSDNKILVAGSFISYSGVSCSNIIKLNLGGSIDETFNNSKQFQYPLNTITIQNDNKILVGGNEVKRLNPNGSIDETFIVNINNSGGGGFIFNPNCNTILVQSNGNIILGGTFNIINDTNKNSICRIENSSDGIVDFQIKLLNGQEFTKVPFEIRNYTII
jgi:uncharacterized delta-60 repeat protein